MEDVKITVYCMAYNCVKFIDRSIKGMLMQKTNVRYKIIIHDDASTDGTADIIRKYANMYPEKIQAIIQTENQYSKGVNIYEQYIASKIEGDYIAICEGDDCWIDENKLQSQYDYMDRHPDCSLCTHNTKIYDLKTGRKKWINHWEDVHILTAEEVFFGWHVHTSSYFIRKKCNDWKGKRYWFGDFMLITWAFYRGQVVALPKVMSMHNFNNPEGVMRKMAEMDIDRYIDKRRECIQYLKEYNKETKFKYDAYVKYRIEYSDYIYIRMKSNYIILHSASKQDSIDAAKKVAMHTYFNKYLHGYGGIKKVLLRYMYCGYCIYPLWKPSMKILLKILIRCFNIL